MTSSALHIYPGYSRPGRALAEALGCPAFDIDIHSFPDGESLVKTNSSAEIALIYVSLDHPNDKLINICFAAQALRDGGAQRVVLVCPYLCYMRQDKAFHVGEAISQKIIGKLLADYFDRIVTFDPHLHRVSSLGEVFSGVEADALSAASLIAEEINGTSELNNALLVGPDSESAQWVGAIAALTDSDMQVATKERLSDREVTINLPAASAVSGRAVVIIDDMISSGMTISRCAEILVKAGASRVEAIVVHALSNDEDLANMKASGVQQVRSCDSVLHSTNTIHLTPVLVEALKKEI